MTDFDFELNLAIMNSLGDSNLDPITNTMTDPESYPTESVKKASTKALTKAKTRCDQCKKRVNLMGLTCRCSGYYCATHLHSEAHSCTFDYVALHRDDLSKVNIKIVAAKVDHL